VIQFKIDENLCIRCGLCSQDCIAGILSSDAIPQMTCEDRCIKCQHCLAVCPVGAVSILGNNPVDSIEIKESPATAGYLETLIKSRRSVRQYKQEDVDPELIKDLLQTVWHAPKGVNNQELLFTVLSSKAVVDEFRDEIYERLIEMMNNDSIPDTPEHSYCKWVARGKHENNEDIIFRGAPHVIIASSPEKAPCPVSDTHIALSYFDLMAQAKGLGTLWNGILKRTIDAVFPDLKKRLSIPADHIVGCAMVFGKPAIKYVRTINPGQPNLHKVDRWNKKGL
jgi:nitroreductase/NAD-dependent dihydropyrimidine dehydrogenase PreA subunit